MPYVFTDKDRIKRMMGIPTVVTRNDAAIEDLQGAVEQMVLDELGLTSSGVIAYSEKIDVTAGGMSEVALTYRAVASITALTISGSLMSATGYELDSGLGIIKLKPLSALFSTGRGIVEVDYTAGFSSVPEDVIYAGNLIATSLFNQQSSAGIKEQRIGDYMVKFDGATGSTIPLIAQRILNKHRRVFARGLGG